MCHRNMANSPRTAVTETFSRRVLDLMQQRLYVVYVNMNRLCQQRAVRSAPLGSLVNLEKKKNDASQSTTAFYLHAEQGFTYSQTISILFT